MTATLTVLDRLLFANGNRYDEPGLLAAVGAHSDSRRPSQVVVTQPVRDHIDGRHDLTCLPLRPSCLKGIGSTALWAVTAR